MRTMKWVTVVVAMVAALWIAGPAMAQEYPPSPEPGAEGAGEERGGGAAEGAGEEAGAGELAFTGADLTMYVVIGLVAVGSGILILRRTKLNKANN
jgi:hypothetical protein